MALSYCEEININFIMLIYIIDENYDDITKLESSVM